MDSSESCHGDSTRRATLQDGKAVILCCSSTIYGSALVAVARLMGSGFSSKDTVCPTSMSKGFNRWGEPDQLLEHVGRIAQLSCIRSRLNRVQTHWKSIGRSSLPLWMAGEVELQCGVLLPLCFITWDQPTKSLWHAAVTGHHPGLCDVCVFCLPWIRSGFVCRKSAVY